MQSQNQARFMKQIDLVSDALLLLWTTSMKVSEERYKG